MKASDLHEAAEERIKTVFRRKRAAEETGSEEETDSDGLKILSSRFLLYYSVLIAIMSDE